MPPLQKESSSVVDCPCFALGQLIEDNGGYSSIIGLDKDGWPMTKNGTRSPFNLVPMGEVNGKTVWTVVKKLPPENFSRFIRLMRRFFGSV